MTGKETKVFSRKTARMRSRRFTSVLLTLVLIVVMMAGEVPERAFAEEDVQILESVRETDMLEVEPKEETALPEETEPQASEAAIQMAVQNEADDNIASGEGWVIDKDGVLTITGDEGMADWKANGNNSFNRRKVKQVVLQTGVTNIVERAFSGCSNLTTVNIPDTVETIGKNAFNSCGLTAVTIPESVQTIGGSAFNSCKLTTVIIPAQVTVISNNMFINCEHLKSVTLPAGITKIEYSAFCGCSALETVTVQGTIPPILGSNVFRNCEFVTDATQGITVPKGYADTYKNAWIPWKAYIKPDPHNLTLVPAKGATCTEAGNNAYYTCSGCNRWFADEEGANEITDKSGVEIAPTGHTYDMEEWKSDSENHWHTCNCGAESEKKAHSFGKWTVTKEATESEEGSKERSCVCGYKDTEIIPKTGGSSPNSGKIETDKEQGENTPDADFGMSKEDLANAVLTTEEQKLLATGTDMKIILSIDNMNASVNQSDKQAVTGKAEKYKVGQYLDINLYKLIGSDRIQVSQTNRKIKLVLTIPDDLKNADSKTTRSYAVVRVHNKAAELLSDTDNDKATITFETDRFSTYALVYKDTAISGGDDGNTNGKVDGSDKTNKGSGDDTEKDNEPKTGETTSVEICATLAMIAGLSYLLDLFGNIKGGMTEQEKKELVASIIAWGRKGRKLRKLVALALIFVILVYYHSIGRQVDVDWKEAYGE